MAEPSVETQLALLLQWQAQVEVHITNTDASLEALKAERNNALKWGVVVLGGALLSLVGFIATFVADHFTFRS